MRRTITSAIIVAALLTVGISTLVLSAGKGKTAPKTPAVVKKDSKPKAKVNGNEVVSKVGDEVITVKDLETAFKKTSPSTIDFQTLGYDSLRNFVELYTNYKLKLKHAADIRLAVEPDVEKELDQNRKAFAGPYLIERLVTEPAVRLMYERRKEEVHVQQIQVAFPPNHSGAPSAADTLHSYEKAKRLLAQIKTGADFTKMAEDSSDEPTVKTTHGILRWLTGGETPRPFEDAAYTVKKGDITPEVVRTPYGYFILKILDRQKRSGSVKSWQILLAVAPGAPKIDTLRQYALADSLLQTIKHGRGTIEDLASKFSQDKNSQAKNGDMGYHDRGDRALPQEYQNAMFSLNDGEFYPRIVRSAYGYHLIKRGDSKQIGAYDDEKENLKVLYKRYFFQDDYNAFLASLRKKYSFGFNSTGFTAFLTSVDTARTTADSTWDKNISAEARRTALYSLRGTSVTLGAFIDTVRARPELRGTALSTNGITSVVQKMVEPTILEYESEHIEDRYPEFKSLMSDVRDGILIYRLEQTEVWNKLQSQMTDSAVKVYWEAHKSSFMTAPRVDISEIYTVSDSLAKSVYKRLMAGERFDSLAKYNTLRVGYKDKLGHWGWFAATDNPLAAKVIDRDSGYISEPFTHESGYAIVRVDAKEKSHEKFYRDAIPDAASQYQEYLSKKIMSDWIDAMKKKYPVTINDSVLKKLAESHK